MKEEVEFRIFKEFYPLLSKPNNAIFNGSVYVIIVEIGDALYNEIKYLTRYVKEKFNSSFYSYSEIKRKYSKKELESARLFQIIIQTAFEPVGEECGTIYDETFACNICGANRKIIGILKLKKNSIPKKDISRTIAGEVVVSEKFVQVVNMVGLKGIEFLPIAYKKGNSNYYQLSASFKVEFSNNTITGWDILNIGTDETEEQEFTISNGYNVKFEKAVYKCPYGHLIGSNLLSEAYVINSHSIFEVDFMASQQMIGVKMGLLRPEPVYFCSPSFRKMVLAEKLTGFGFEVANIEGG
jgi:hypothetical protein